ncbi:sensor domain-containing diguanylate cyclase [Methylovirgula sp. 4M-Z18]|uniref:sensor domain-containing diguanylate cyclase n=1 Tax=Methylovirgula sp. 4M-Z18 TaxID=2293567 RepID=UPI001FDFCC73|nr:sensor domain-containing diguanylate cyclase [Methylovirgula sp. 4M-Z18]
MFELAPVSLWLEDYTELKALFDGWRRAGIADLRAYLGEDFDRVRLCASKLKVVKVNAKTLALYEVANLDELVANLGRIFRDDMLLTHLEELVQLWDGKTLFASDTVNYTMSGRRLDIQLKGSILPGHEESWSRVLVAIDDVTDRETARRKLSVSEDYAHGLLQHSPVSLWVEDFSRVKQLIDEVRERGIIDFRVFTDVHPEFVQRCMSEIRVIDVNRRTLELFGAPSKQVLLQRLGDIFRDGMAQPFREQLIDLWDGKLFQQREVVNYALDGTELYFLMQFSVLPGREHNWSLVQVALTDITARKKAEAYLEFLGKHDVLTKLYNRSFYVDEINRLERKGPWPVTIIIADLNGLKSSNDHHGHGVGDELLRRAGEVLAQVVEKSGCAARIGGDEFAIIMPGADEHAGEAMMNDVHRLAELNNQFHGATPLSFSMGAATSRRGERLDAVARRADAEMYDAKRRYYEERYRG